MAGNIFISYRRDDAAGFAGRLYDQLELMSPAIQLFMDVDDIAPGLDFVKVLEDEVAKCDVFLAVIGQQWLNATDVKTGTRRLDDPNDFVRIEIETALKRDIRVIPLLVAGATMPVAEKLPTTLKPLTRRNGVRLSHDRFRSDCTRLIRALERAFSDVDKKHTSDLVRAGAGEGASANEARRLKAQATERENSADAERRIQEAKTRTKTNVEVRRKLKEKRTKEDNPHNTV